MIEIYIQFSIDSDECKGVIRIPIAQVLANQRACSGSCQTLPLAWMVEQRGPLIRFTLVQAMVLFRCPILTIQPPMVP